jgi:hypothetical protein
MIPWLDAKQVAAHAVKPELLLPACYHFQPQPVQTKSPQLHKETLFSLATKFLMHELAALDHLSESR